MDILVGKVLKAQGIKGELKVQCYLDDVNQLTKLKTVTIAKTSYKVKSVRQYEGFGYMYLDGITDRNSAELLRDWDIYADKEQIALPKDSYFIQDLLGCTVVDDKNTKWGQLVDISQYGSADVYTVRDNQGKLMSFPWLKDLCVAVDIVAKRIVVKAERLQQVMVYQDED